MCVTCPDVVAGAPQTSGLVPLRGTQSRSNDAIRISTAVSAEGFQAGDVAEARGNWPSCAF